ncbi:hypothetical protein BC833DRAFT_600193 [Globomyces pollinis-pini]|nr:hypothetical protein BC833DRAFT_600193 [Globomyces pollinis-pini]
MIYSVYNHSTTYRLNESIPIYYDKTSSDITHLPIPYVNLPFVCSPLNSQSNNWEDTFKEVQQTKSPIELNVLQDNKCQVICEKQIHLNSVDILKEMIKDRYSVHWLLDDLIGATVDNHNFNNAQARKYSPGFLLGFEHSKDEDENEYVVYNHLNLNVLYNRLMDESLQIVGFEVIPRSIKWKQRPCVSINDQDEKYIIRESKSTGLAWTYSVNWFLDDTTTWDRRWDRYTVDHHKFGLNAFYGSVFLVFLFNIIISIIFLVQLKKSRTYPEAKTLLKSRQSNLENAKPFVFNATPIDPILMGLISVGIQMLITVFFSIAYSICFDSTLDAIFILYIIAAFPASYFGTRISNSLGGPLWSVLSFIASSIVPLLVISLAATFHILSFIFSITESTPQLSVHFLGILWLLSPLPFHFYGSYIGHCHQDYHKVHKLNIQVPNHPWYLRDLESRIITGSIPFFIFSFQLNELFKNFTKQTPASILTTLHLMTLVIVISTLIEITLLTVFLLLTNEDYQWHWKSFQISNSSSIFIFIYTFYFYYYINENTQPDFAFYYCKFGLNLCLVFFCLIGCILYWISTGTIGFIASFVALKLTAGEKKIA